MRCIRSNDEVACGQVLIKPLDEVLKADCVGTLVIVGLIDVDAQRESLSSSDA